MNKVFERIPHETPEQRQKTRGYPKVALLFCGECGHEVPVAIKFDDTCGFCEECLQKALALIRKNPR